MGKYEWLLFLHVTGAFLFPGGTVVAGVLNVAALRRERPSEIAVLLRLIGRTVIGFGIGFFLVSWSSSACGSCMSRATTSATAG
jgi:hypothetical protein